MLYTHENLDGKVFMDDEQRYKRGMLIGGKTTGQGPSFVIAGIPPERHCGVFDPIKKQFVGIFDPSSKQVVLFDKSLEIVHDRGYTLHWLLQFHDEATKECFQKFMDRAKQSPFLA